MTTVSKQPEIPPRSLKREGPARCVLRYPGYCASGIYPRRMHCEQRILCSHPALFAGIDLKEDTKIVG
ncbi:hypothetical protein TNCV_1669731 [Trichonephila clavipes]|nr:hypothetical protein TNCV_1669731 [Trichonephila clavipes]